MSWFLWNVLLQNLVLAGLVKLLMCDCSVLNECVQMSYHWKKPEGVFRGLARLKKSGLLFFIFPFFPFFCSLKFLIFSIFKCSKKIFVDPFMFNHNQHRGIYLTIHNLIIVKVKTLNKLKTFLVYGNDGYKN